MVVAEPVGGIAAFYKFLTTRVICALRLAVLG
jgi:hypothetical protein